MKTKRIFLAAAAAFLLIFTLISCTKTGFTDQSSSGGEQEQPELSREASLVLAALRDDMNNYWNGFYPADGSGLTFEAENLELSGDGRHFSFDMGIKNSKGLDLTIPLKGIYFITGSEENPDAVVCVGGVKKLDEDNIAFCGLGFAGCINKDTLELTEINEDLSGFENDVWINSVIMDENGSFTLALTEMGSRDYSADEENVTKVFIYGPSGERKVFELSKALQHERSLSYGTQTFLEPGDPRESCIFDTEKGTLLTFDSSAYDLETGERYYFDKILSFDDESRKAVIYSLKNTDDYSLAETFAVLYENEAQKGVIFLGDEPITYREPSESSYAKITGSISEDGKVSITNDFCAMTIELDFVKGTKKVEYNIKNEQLQEKLAESADKNYSLWSYAESGGGDIVLYNTALKNEKTGEIKFFGTGGGMYGGWTEVGFLKNNDIYCTDYYVLKIYDPETLELKFDLSKKFPLGLIKEEGFTRYSVTFRRNPEDMSFIVVYFEVPEVYDETEVTDENGWRIEYSFTYKIGFFDAEGNLLESYDTGVKVWSTYFGLQPAVMRYSPEKLTIIVMPAKGNEGLTITFDMNTKESTVSY